MLRLIGHDILSKMSRYFGIMYKIKKLLSIEARLQFYHSFIKSLIMINYCSFLWGFASNSNIGALLTKRANVKSCIL